MEEYLRSRVPWSTGPSLKQMTDEVGVDFDRFIDGLNHDRSDVEMAAEFNVSEKIIKHLRDHFMSHGVGSIMGQD
ncbi:MAG: helix-turn-helix domain-containing protein [Peptococcaceae bacterium]|nr:helix-turn-helix domain-containing protein [Peptococcaceae bacterium]